MGHRTLLVFKFNEKSGVLSQSTLATRSAKVPTVSRLTPVMRAVARMPVPSVRAAMISNCLASSALRKANSIVI